jgi:hypothetical protein
VAIEVSVACLHAFDVSPGDGRHDAILAAPWQWLKLQTDCKRTGPDGPDSVIRNITTEVRFCRMESRFRMNRHEATRTGPEKMSEDAKFALGF